MSRAASVAIVVGACLAGGCMARSPQLPPLRSIEFHYRALAHPRPARAAASTSVYRAVARSLSTTCEMWPNDSAYFDQAVARCGGRRAIGASLGRLFLERAASPTFLRPVRIDGRLRWVDRSVALDCR